MKPIAISLLLVLTTIASADLTIEQEVNTVSFKKPSSMEFAFTKDPFSLRVLAPDGKTVLIAPNGRDAMFSFLSPDKMGTIVRLLSWTVYEDRVNLVTETDMPGMAALLTLNMGDADAPELYVSIREGGKSPDLDRVALIVGLEKNERLFGLGTPETGSLDRRGRVVEMWKKAGSRPDDSLIPLYMSTRGYGIYVEDYGRGVFDLGGSAPDSTTIVYPGADLKLRFLWGPEFESIVSNYTRLTGRPPLPAPRYFLPARCLPPANTTAEVVFSDLLNLEKRGISVGSVVLGPQWMTSRMSWEFDPRGFPEPKEFFRGLHDSGYAVALWTTPYNCSVSPNYQEGLDRGYCVKRRDGSVWSEPREEKNYLDGSVYGADRSLMDPTNPDVVAWWNEKIRSMEALGIDGFLLSDGVDVPRYALFHNGETGETLQNRFPLYYDRAFSESSLLISRTGCAGSQSFTHFLAPGDYEPNLDPQKGLPALLRSALSAGLSGFPFWMTEIGISAGGGSEKVLARWVQLAAFSPGIALTASPWEYGEKNERICAKYLAIHESLLPYLQSCALEASERGTPLMRPLVYSYRTDTQAAARQDQFYLGDRLMVAPVVTEDVKRAIYFPEGAYERVFGPAARYSGPNLQTLQVPVDECPVFLRQGAIVPTIASAGLSESWGSVFEGGLVWLLFPQGNSTFRYFDGIRRSTVEVRENLPSGRAEIEIRLPESPEPVGLVVFGRPVPVRIRAEGMVVGRVNYPEELKMGETSAWTLTGKGRTVLRLVPPIPSVVAIEE